MLMSTEGCGCVTTQPRTMTSYNGGLVTESAFKIIQHGGKNVELVRVYNEEQMKDPDYIQTSEKSERSSSSSPDYSFQPYKFGRCSAHFTHYVFLEFVRADCFRRDRRR